MSQKNTTTVRSFSHNPDEGNNHHQVTVPEQEREKSFTGTRFLEVHEVNDLNEAYEQIVYRRKNVFILPTGAAGEKFISEITRPLNLLTNDTPLKNIVLKTIHIMPALFLRKQSKKSKARENLNALDRRMKLWEEDNINELLEESKTLQERLPSNITPINIEKIRKSTLRLLTH